MKVLKDDLPVTYSWHGEHNVIPAGTPVIPAENLDEDGYYWVQPDARTSDLPVDLLHWADVYGFRVTEDQVEERSDAS